MVASSNLVTPTDEKAWKSDDCRAFFVYVLRAEVGGAGDAKSQSRSLPKFNKMTIPAFYRGQFSKRAIFVVFFIFKDGYREGMGFIRGL